jgi:hypothetical protein
MKYIYHHLGLGDHIICNGLVRHYHKQYGDVAIFCKKHNYDNVKFMYSDLNGLNIIRVNDDSDVIQMLQYLRVEPIVIGFNKLNKFTPPETFDVGFYKTVDKDFQIRFDEFYIPRNHERELEVYNELNPNNEPYIFIHDDKSRGFSIDWDKLPKNIKVIENDTRYGLFDMLTIISSADEVHVMQSSLKDLINSYTITKPKFYLHNYVRGYGDDLNSVGLNKFEIIN